MLQQTTLLASSALGFIACLDFSGELNSRWAQVMEKVFLCEGIQKYAVGLGAQKIFL